jgi:HAMP domain-containing protein
MKLRTKFTLILAATFVAGLLVTGLISYQILFSNAQKEISERAQLMMESAMAMRTYTVKNIKPLLKPLAADTFHPETVPAFAAMRAFDSLREHHPDYTYREAALNPTNIADRAVEWENDIITHFRNHEEAKEISGSRQTPSGEVMYIARPIQISQASCLDCHSTPDAAPATVLKAYGSNNGFGWKMNEVVGAQIVAVPMTVTLDRARSTFTIFMGALTAAAVLAVVSLNFAMRWMVVRPISELSQLCDQVSKGDFSADDPKTAGNDEIASLGSSFVRMKVSLQKAMKMLED